MVRVAGTATHRGEFMAPQPTGKQVTFSWVDIVRIQDGKQIEHWVGLDLLSLMQQLGTILAVGQSE